MASVSTENMNALNRGNQASHVAAFRKQKIEMMKEAGFSDEFVALMQNAWEKDVVFLSLDRDAQPEPGFPLFDAITGEMYNEYEALVDYGPTP